MVSKIMSMLTAVMAACVTWFEQVVSATGTGGLIVAAVGIVFIISLLLMPIRGAAIGAFASSTVNHIKSKSNKQSKNNNKK